MSEWKSLFRSHILSRGYGYYVDGAVMELEKTEQGFRAIVEGTNNYEVEILLHDGEVYDMYCDCPYAADGNHCKHMAAVLFAMEDKIEKDRDRQGVQGIAKKGSEKEEIREVIARIPENELREVFAKLMRKNPVLYNHIMLEYAAVTPEQMRHLKNRVDEIAWENSDRSGYVDYYHGMDYVRALENFLDNEVRVLIRKRYFMEAFELTNYVFQDVGTRDIDGSDGEHGLIAESCYGVWKKILESCDAQQREQIRLWFRGHRTNFVVDFMEEYIEDFLINELRDEDILNEKLGREIQRLREIEKRVKKGAMGYSYYHGYGSPILTCMDLMEKLEYPKEKIDEFRKQYRRFPDVRLAEIQEYVQEKNYGKAIEVLKESREMDNDNGKLTAEYSHRLIEIYERTGDMDSYKEELLYQVFRYTQSNLVYIHKLREICEKQEWENYREKLLECENLGYIRFELLKEEKMYGRLLEEIRAVDSVSCLDRYEKELGKYFPDKVRDVYADYVRMQAERVANRNAYRDLMRYLKKLKKYPAGEQTAERIAQEWRSLYKRRPAMMDELSKAGFR